MSIYLNKLRKSFPFINIDFSIDRNFMNLMINKNTYESIYYYKAKKIWRIYYLNKELNFEEFLDNFINGLIYYNIY